MSELILFPPTFIFHKKIKNHEEFKEKYLQEIVNTSEKHVNECRYTWNGVEKDTSKAVTNYHQNDNFSLFDQKFFNMVISDSINELFEKNDFYKKLEPATTKIAHIWWNVYQPGGFADLHAHGPNRISGIYFLELNEENTTVFIDDVFFGKYIERTPYVKEGDVLLFPSELLHYVLPCSKRRVTISFNLSTVFKNRKIFK